MVDFPRQAAADPAVVSIKYTLYRAVDQSPFVAGLIHTTRRSTARRGSWQGAATRRQREKAPKASRRRLFRNRLPGSQCG
ncbi:hypothetical protein ACWPMX_11775 [Tsuneonella sp. HG094]